MTFRDEKYSDMIFYVFCEEMQAAGWISFIMQNHLSEQNRFACI